MKARQKAASPAHLWISAGVVLATGGLFPGSTAVAQIATPPRATEAYVNGVGAGLSIGEQVNRDATFWGWSVEYSRYLSDRWTFGTALTWDEETEEFPDKPDAVTATFTAVASISYSVTDRFSLTTGLGKGFANDDNPEGKMKFSNGDLGTGIVAGYAFPISNRRSISASLAYEFNLTQNERSISVDVSYGWSF